MRDSFSPDRVVADPALNAKFISECRQRGLESSPQELNKSLLNLRKAGLLPDLESTPTVFPDQEDYCFAAEIAIRFLERRESVSLDDVICDPGLAAEFDSIAERISPGQTPLQYRWAALSLRKNRRLRPELLGRALKPIHVEQFAVHSLRIEQIPNAQGLYLFFAGEKVLYIGEASSLRVRVKKHLDFSDNRGLAQWLWSHGPNELFLEIQVLDAATTTRVRRAMEVELIRSRKSEFNVAGAL